MNHIKTKSKIIFIISAGHSGSTLLDLLIGTLPSVVSTGELIWLPWQIWRDGKICTATPKQDVCTCLKTFRECSFWRRVLDNMAVKTGIDIVNDPLNLNISFLRNNIYTSGMTIKYRLLRKIFKEAIIYGQKWIVDLIITNQRESILNTLILYDNIGQVMQTPFVVDSSKDLLRAYAVWKQRPNDVKIILLYKDAKSYAASGKHWDQNGNLEVRLKEWVHSYKNNIIPVIEKMEGCNILTVKYDDMAQNPNSMRKRLGRFIGVFTDVNWEINTQTMHIVAGNPMRFGGKIEIKYDDRWRSELSIKEQNLAEFYELEMKSMMDKFKYEKI